MRCKIARLRTISLENSPVARQGESVRHVLRNQKPVAGDATQENHSGDVESQYRVASLMSNEAGDRRSDDTAKIAPEILNSARRCHNVSGTDGLGQQPCVRRNNAQAADRTRKQPSRSRIIPNKCCWHNQACREHPKGDE